MKSFAFQKNHLPQHYFTNGGSKYNLHSLYCQEIKAPSPIFFNSNKNRTQFKNSLFTTSFTPNHKLIFCSYDLKTCSEKEWYVEANMPYWREMAGVVRLDDCICVFGGKKENIFFNDIFSFCPEQKSWINLAAESPINPQPRIPLIFSSVGSNNIFLFGGSNNATKFYDAFTMRNKKWMPLKIFNHDLAAYIWNLEGLNFCSTNGKVYVSGGFYGTLLSNQLFELEIHDDTIFIKQIGNNPNMLGQHSLSKLGDSSLVLASNKEGSGLTLQVYNIREKQWISVPHNVSFVLNNPQICNDKNALYIFGQNQQKLDKMVKLNFDYFNLTQSQICVNCKTRLEIKERQEFHNPKKPFVSNGLIYNLALQITFPFQAIQLLLDCAVALHATTFSIESCNTKSALTYLDIRFNGDVFSREQFSSIISHSYLNDPLVLQIIDKLKQGALRLGKTFLFVSINGENRRVFLFSVDCLIISLYDEIYEYFAFEERIADEFVYTQEGIMHKKFIFNQLEAFLPNPQNFINSITNHGIIIFDSNVIMTNQKMYYAEMIPSPVDMQLCKNSKKVDFLATVGFQLEKNPEVSLASFLPLCYLNPSLQTIHLQNHVIHLEPNIYFKSLSELASKNKVKQIFNSKIRVKNLLAECLIYQACSEQYLPDTNGVLIYNKGRLINRMDVKFGDLFLEKFFMTKYKRTFNLWEHMGIINVLEGGELKGGETSFKGRHFNMLLRQIKKQIFYQEGKNREEQKESESKKLITL